MVLYSSVAPTELRQTFFVNIFTIIFHYSIVITFGQILKITAVAYTNIYCRYFSLACNHSNAARIAVDNA